MLISQMNITAAGYATTMEKVNERSGKNLFWSVKNSGVVLDKLKAKDFNTTSLYTYDFSTLSTTLPHNLIKDNLLT